MRIAFVTNFCAHYRIKTFETLARYHDVDHYFFSAGDEWHWMREHGVARGDFRSEYLPGFRVGRTRVSPTLPWRLYGGQYDAYIKCINGRFALAATYLVAQAKRRPFILWTGIWSRLQTPFHRLLFPLTRYIYHHADAIVAYGEHVKRYLISEGVPAERVFVAPHAIDNDAYNRIVSHTEKDAWRRRLGILPGQKLVLYVGRLVPEKGLTYLLDAFAAAPYIDTVLVMAGSGPEEPRLRFLAERHGIADRVRFAGYVPPQDIVPLYALAEVLVLPSITTPFFKEPWGLVVNEAMNQGVPVIATEAVGAAAGGLVQNAVNGLVVPERDSSALAAAIGQVARDAALRERMSANARAIVAAWDNERMVRGFRDAIAYVSEQLV